MEKEIAQKVQRCLELSCKFTKSENDVFGNQFEGYKAYSGESICYDSMQQKSPAPTRTEKLKAKLAETVILSEEYEEFITLRGELQTYFSALNKLTNN